ncbi:MAG: DUF1844 domain-containing protein [Deltaproteobacteria bacterium]|nr:DUF1844 domain-containing protein [Deltaproteobacteria bacterium]
MREGDDRDRDGEPSFRVIDRRRFASDGSERNVDEEGQKEASSAKPSAPSPEPARAAPPPPHPGERRPSEPASPQFGEPRGAPYDAEPGESLEPSFGTLVLSLSTQALMCLGEIPEGPGGEIHRDLAAARDVIDLLGVLERKTQGNLTADEQALLSRILYDLRIRYVQLTRVEGA